MNTPEVSDDFDRRRRRVLWSMPTGLYLLGSGVGQDRNLMTLNLATQVSLDPKQVGVAVLKEAYTHQLMLEHGCFALSLLDREERAVVRKFVKPAQHDPAEQTLNGFEYRTATTGAPFLAQAASYLDLSISDCVDVGDHSFFIGRVVDADFLKGEETAVLRMEDTRMNYGG